MNTKTIQHPERDIVVTPVKVKNLPAFLAAIEPVVRQLGASSAGATGATGAKDDLLLALATHAPKPSPHSHVGGGLPLQITIEANQFFQLLLHLLYFYS